MGRIIKLSRRAARAALMEVGINQVILMTVLVVLALMGAIVLGFRQTTTMVDRLDRQSEQKLITNYLERFGEGSIAQQKVQLTWDDAFVNAGSRVDPAWADTYLGEFLYSNFGYSQMYLVDADGRLLRAWTNGLPGGAQGYGAYAPAVRDELAKMAQNSTIFGNTEGFTAIEGGKWPVNSKGRLLTRWGRMQVQHDGQPGQLTIASIVPDTNMALLTKTPNHLVAFRPYDPAFLNTMSKALLLEPIRSSPLQPSDSKFNTIALTGSKGEQLGWLSWEFSARGAMVQGRMRPLFIAMVLIMLALMVGVTIIVRELTTSLTRRRESEAKALYQVRHDALTGLVSRSWFLELLDQELAAMAAQKKPSHGLALAFFDLDNFKLVNDSLGHTAGDALLSQVAQRCGMRLPQADVLARLGGDEFVLLRRCPRAQGKVSALGEELMAVFAAPFKVEGRLIDVTASCGISWAFEPGSSAEDLLRKADMALFQAKQRGRARWRGFTEEMAQSVNRRIALEVELRKALQADQLTIAYQPIVEASSGKIAGAEALLRWNHAEFGPVSPGLFVPAAEQAGLMPMLGWWTIAKVFEHHRAWPHIDISINLSPLQLTQRGFLDDLEALTKEYRVDPARITFEVTEGILLERGSGVFDVLGQLRGLGFGLALDDFGTGYSSLAYLRTFRFDRLKIDRSFVQNIENDIDALSILKTIVALGRTLNTRTVAEGVETLVQRELVVSAGCELIQGFFHYRPLVLEDFSALIDQMSAEAPRLRAAG